MGRFLNRLALLTAILSPIVAIAVAAPRTFVIDPAESRAVVTVGKTGLFSFAGHSHEISSPMKGTIELDTADPARSTLRMEIDAKALVVSPKDEPPKDVPEVQQAMLSEKCLDVEKFPTITFQSKQVTVTKQGESAWELTVSGDLTLHGVTKPLSFPAIAQLAGDKLTAHGQFVFKQSEYGIKPISIGGVVKVKDELTINYSVVAHLRSHH